MESEDLGVLSRSKQILKPILLFHLFIDWGGPKGIPESLKTYS